MYILPVSQLTASCLTGVHSLLGSMQLPVSQMYTLHGQPFSCQPFRCTLYLLDSLQLPVTGVNSPCKATCGYLSHRCTLSLQGSLQTPVSQVYTLPASQPAATLSHRGVHSTCKAACSYRSHRFSLSPLGNLPAICLKGVHTLLAGQHHPASCLTCVHSPC